MGECKGKLRLVRYVLLPIELCVIALLTRRQALATQYRVPLVSLRIAGVMHDIIDHP